MPIKLLDNTLFTEKGNPPFSVELGVLNQQQSNRIKFVKSINGRTIEELNSGENGILVWPYSFKKGNVGKDDIEKMTILNCRMNSDGNTIEELQTGNLAGFIGNGKAQIEINSRFSSESNGNIQDFFLYYMLSKAFHTNIVNMEVGAGSLKQLNLMLFIFPQLLKEAFTQGVFKQYVKREYNDSNVKGTIDVNRHLRFNYPANGRIAYNTREFSYDNSITQLIRHAIECISTKPMGRAILNADKDTVSCVRTIMQVTPAYSKKARLQVVNDNKRPLSHPYFTKYKALQQICLAILRNELISHGTQDKKVHGVLIDISWLWEEYIAGVLAEKTGFRHHTRENAFHLLRKTDKTVFQTVIPDYLDKDKGLVADAKYIPLHKYDHLDAERAAAVYYKTIMYMHRFGSKKGFLFHPCKRDDIKWIEESDKYNHIVIEKNTISCDYEVVGTDSSLHEVGMIIPNCSDYKGFCAAMEEAERDFLEKIENVCNNNGFA